MLSCDSCTDLAESWCDDGDPIDCRDWLYQGRTYEMPPVELQAIATRLRDTVEELSADISET